MLYALSSKVAPRYRAKLTKTWGGLKVGGEEEGANQGGQYNLFQRGKKILVCGWPLTRYIDP